MHFQFATATRIIFGPATLAEVAPLASELGKRPLVVTGGDASRATPLLATLVARSLSPVSFSVAGEPSTELVSEGVRQARATGCDHVIGFGGGSVLDAGKAIAMLLANGGEPLDYLEVIGRGRPIKYPSAPYIAVPTTAGTGAEVTRNAVLRSPEHRVKVSLRSPLMLPTFAVIDPELTHSVPPAITASTGLDALTQLVEPFVSHLANPLTDALCREGLCRAARALPRAFENGGDAAAREDMAVASLFGGLALANAGLGAVHGFAGPIGGMFPAPHGIICARLLPEVMAANVGALQARDPQSPALARYDQVAQLLTGRTTATAAAGVDWARDVCRLLQVPDLGQFGVSPQDFTAIAAQAQRASSMKGNPVRLTDRDLVEILERAT